jgi:hypothetical protein
MRSAGALLRKEKHMVTIKVKDGTPEGGQSLCTTCRWAHIVKGFGVSQEKIHCCWLAYNPPVPFPVSQCSSYDDKRIPSKRDMEKIAWILMTKKAGRTKATTQRSFPRQLVQPKPGNDERFCSPPSRKGAQLICILFFIAVQEACHARRTFQRTALLSSAAVSGERATRQKPK